MRVGHRRDDRQVLPQGERAAGDGDQSPLRRLEAAPRRRQVRRLRRDGHRQPDQERHPRQRGPLLARGRDRPAEPQRAHPRGDVEAPRPPPGRAEHLLAIPPGVLAPAHPPDLGRARLRLPEGRADRGADLRPRERAVLRGPGRGALRPARGGQRRRVHHARAARGVHHHRSQGAPRRDRRSVAVEVGRRAVGLSRLLHDSQVRARALRAGAGRACGHRPRWWLDVEQGGAGRSRDRTDPGEGLPALQGQPDPGHQGAARRAEGRRGEAGRHPRGHRLRRHRLRRRRARAVRAQRRERGRDGGSHDERRALLRRHRRHLRHRRAGHQGPVHEERGHRQLPPLELVQRRQRDAAAGDRRVVRRAGHAIRRGGLRRRAGAEVQLRLRCISGHRPGQLPEGGLLQGGDARRSRPGATEERVAVRGADPAHGGARHEVRAPGRHAVQPRRAQGAGRLHQRARSQRRGVRPPAHRRGRRDRRRHGNLAGGEAQGALLVHRSRGGHPPRLHDQERRGDGLSLLREQLQADLHRHDPAGRLDQPLHRRFLLREGHRRVRSCDDGSRRRAEEARQGVPQPRRLRGEARVPALLQAGADARRRLALEEHRGQEGAARSPPRGGHATVQARHPGGPGHATARPYRHAARAQHVLDGAVLPDLLRGARHPAQPRRLQRRDQRGDVGRGRKVRLHRPVLPEQGRAGAHPQLAVQEASAGREEAAQVHLLSHSHPRAQLRGRHDGQRQLPHRGRRARRDEGGLPPRRSTSSRPAESSSSIRRCRSWSRR